MKRILHHLLCLLLLLWSIPALALGITSRFNYSGSLRSGQSQASGSYDFCFALYSSGEGGSQAATPMTNMAVVISNGLFSTQIDFGTNVYDGTAYWLEIGVRTNGTNNGFTMLSPRQELTATPYASYAPNAGTASSAATASAVVSNAVTGAGIQDAAITEAKLASGAVVKTLNGLRDHVTLSAGSNITLNVVGNDVQVSAGGVGGFPIGMREFTATGSNSFTVPVGVTKLLVEVWGGGGGGGGDGGGFPSTGAGAGGGAGGYSRSIVSVNAGEAYAVLIGAGGFGSNTGGAGGSSSFRIPGGATLLFANGGSGGANGDSDVGGAGGTGDPGAMIRRAGIPGGSSSGTTAGVGGRATIGSIEPVGANGGNGSGSGSGQSGGPGYVFITW